MKALHCLSNSCSKRSMKQALQLKLGQQLTLTPQLQQAIKLFQLSTLDLQQAITETLESNPLLDEEEISSEAPLVRRSKSRSISLIQPRLNFRERNCKSMRLGKTSCPLQHPLQQPKARGVRMSTLRTETPFLRPCSPISCGNLI